MLQRQMLCSMSEGLSAMLPDQSTISVLLKQRGEPGNLIGSLMFKVLLN